MNVTMNRVATIPLPSNMYTATVSVGFVDGIPLPESSDFRSAALVFGPATGILDQETMGVVAYNKTTQQYQFTQAPQDGPVSWPRVGSLQAACGVSGGLVAFAVNNQEGPGYSIQIHNSVVSNGNWDMVYRPVTASEGTIQSMLEHDGRLYVFIKDTQNGFLVMTFPNFSDSGSEFSGSAAAAFFPKPSQQAGNTRMLRTIAAYNNVHAVDEVHVHVYAIDESYANVLCGSLQRFGAKVDRFPLAQPDTWGLLIDSNRKKVYGTISSGTGEFLIPYSIADSGALNRAGPTIVSRYPVCPAIDETLGLLYLPSAAAPFQVFTTDTDTVVTVSGSNPPTTDNFEGAMVGSWADAGHGVFYASGRLSRNDPPSNILVYEVSVTGN